MSRCYLCDQCEYSQTGMLPYRLCQLTEPDNEDDDYDTVTYHFCSTECLDVFVMALPRDEPEEPID